MDYFLFKLILSILIILILFLIIRKNRKENYIEFGMPSGEEYLQYSAVELRPGGRQQSRARDTAKIRSGANWRCGNSCQ